MLRMTPRWSFPDFAAAVGHREASSIVKDVVPLGPDAFCLLLRGGRAEAFAATPEPGANVVPTWLTSLHVFEGESVRLMAHLRAAKALLTVVAAPAGGDEAPRGTLFVRLLDVTGILAGQLRTRDCGGLGQARVRPGGFVEYDDQNHCIWTLEGDRLRCWDAVSFRPRFNLGPWLPEEMPNVRFTRGHVGLLRPMTNGTTGVWLHGCADGKLGVYREVDLPPDSAAFVFLELLNHLALLKREGCCAVVVDLLSGRQCALPNTEAWEPDLFVFLPTRNLALAQVADSLEIWRCADPAECRRVGVVRRVEDFGTHRFSVDEQLGCALAVIAPRPLPGEVDGSAKRPRVGGEDLVLLDLLRFGGVRGVIHGACEGGGGVAKLFFGIAEGVLVVLGRSGGLFAYALPTVPAAFLHAPAAAGGA